MVGRTVSVLPIDGFVILSVQWVRVTGQAQADIPGATSTQYTIQDQDAGKSIYPKVTGYLSSNVREVRAAQTAPVVVSSPVITKAAAGSAVEFSPAQFSGEPAPSVQNEWFINGTSVGSVTPIASVVGSQIMLAQKAVNAAGQVTAYSNTVTVSQVLSPLRAVGMFQFLPWDLSTQLTGYDIQFFREAIRIGSGDVAELVFAFVNWAINVTQTTDITVDRMAIETWDGSAVTPITFGGQRSVSLPAGANDIQSDTLLPSALGLQKFENGQKFWLRIKYLVPSAATFPSTRFTDKNSAYIIPGVTRAVDSSASRVIPDSVIDSTGPIVPASGSQIALGSTFLPIVLGKFIGGDKPTLLINGSSVEYGEKDSTRTSSVLSYPHITDVHAGGYANRACLSLGMASLMLAKASSRMSWFTAQAARNYGWQKYCIYGLIGFGANDISGGATASATISGISNIVSLMRSNGAQKVLCNEIGNRTTSTDSWATEDGQTYISKWEVGGVADAVRSGIAAMVGSTIDDYVEHPSIRGVDNHKWVVNGSADYATPDGIHPAPAGAALMATNLIAAINAL